MHDGPTRKKQGENRRSSCDHSPSNPFTKIFSAYLHVCLSFFSILWSLLSLLYLFSQSIALSVALAICDSESLLSVFFYVCLLPLLVANSLLLTVLWLTLCVYVLPLLVAASPPLHTHRVEHPHFQTFGHPKLVINTQADNRSPR